MFARTSATQRAPSGRSGALARAAARGPHAAAQVPLAKFNSSLQINIPVYQEKGEAGKVCADYMNKTVPKDEVGRVLEKLGIVSHKM